MEARIDRDGRMYAYLDIDRARYVPFCKLLLGINQASVDVSLGGTRFSTSPGVLDAILLYTVINCAAVAIKVISTADFPKLRGSGSATFGYMQPASMPHKCAQLWSCKERGVLEIARGIRRSVGPPTACRPGVLLTPSHPILNLHTRPRTHIPYSEPLPYTALPLCVNVMRPHAYHSARRLTFPRPSMWKVHIIRSVCCCPFRSSLGEPNRMPLPVSMLIQVSSSPSTGSSAASAATV